MNSPRYTKYLEFVQLPAKGKTEIWEINSRSHGSRLGYLRWYGVWRQYVFWPETATLYNRDCLKDIEEVLHSLMLERKSETHVSGEPI